MATGSSPVPCFFPLPPCGPVPTLGGVEPQGLRQWCQQMWGVGVEQCLLQWDPTLPQVSLWHALHSASGIGVDLAHSCGERLQAGLLGEVIYLYRTGTWLSRGCALLSTLNTLVQTVLAWRKEHLSLCTKRPSSHQMCAYQALSMQRGHLSLNYQWYLIG